MNHLLKSLKIIFILLCFNQMIAQQSSTAEVIIGSSFIEWPISNFNPISSSYRDVHLGGQVNKSIYKGIFLSTGLGVRRQRLQTEYNFAIFIAELSGEDPLDFPQLLDSDTMEDTRHWFIDVPVLLRYQFTKGKITPFAESGIISSYYFRSTSYLKMDDQPETNYKGKYQEIENFHFAATASIGISYAISKSFSLTMRGRLFRQLKSQNELTAIDAYYGYGLNIGLMFFPF